MTFVKWMECRIKPSYIYIYIYIPRVCLILRYFKVNYGEKIENSKNLY